MSFFVNLNYSFARHMQDSISGSIIPCSAMPKHTLERRVLKGKHLKKCFFDPQLYLSCLTPAENGETIIKLASYSWFGVSSIPVYKSDQLNQSQWRENARAQASTIRSISIPASDKEIASAIKECIDLQLLLKCEGIIIPSPLTIDSNTSYTTELKWLDIGIKVAAELKVKVPLYATIAFTDTCVRYVQATKNPFLSLIADAVTSRSIQGVYIVMEQGSETAESKNCTSNLALSSILHLIHMCKNEAKVNVIVNYLGAFGFICSAIGADVWAADWYKSMYRFKIADQIAGGRAYPKYWSFPCVMDINMNEDFDAIVKSNMLALIADSTPSSSGLLDAAKNKVRAEDVPAWAYRMSNVTAAKCHFLESVLQAENMFSKQFGVAKIDMVEKWLETASSRAEKIQTVIGSNSATEIRHVRPWYEALKIYRADHNV